MSDIQHAGDAPGLHLLFWMVVVGKKEEARRKLRGESCELARDAWACGSKLIYELIYELICQTP